MNLQFGHGLVGTPCLCSTWHHLRGPKVWKMEQSEDPFTQLVVDAGETQMAGGSLGCLSISLWPFPVVSPVW